jgi:transcriptional regulator with XRE-family HTH domain
MTITEYRKEHGLTIEDFAARIGRSKGHACDIENAGRCSAKLAMAIEAATNGQVNAASLNDEIAAARKQAA